MIKPMLVASALLILGLSAQETDNTKTNQRDRAAGAITADQQKMNAADRELARKIRKSVVDDKSLASALAKPARLRIPPESSDGK